MMNNASKIVESLKADEIRQRLIEIGREERALRVLLRAANHLGKGDASRPTQKYVEVETRRQ